MEERMSWGDAFTTALNNLVGINNESAYVRKIRLLFFAIFLFGTVWAGYSYLEAQKLMEEKEFLPSGAPTTLEEDRKRLNQMTEQVKVTSALRVNSSVLVQSMQGMGKYVFGDPTLLPPDPSKKDIVVVVPEVIVDMPPSVVVRAIMIVGKQRVAIMDIPEVGTGLLVKVGDTFKNNKGRVMRIAPDKVTLRWGGKNWDIAPGF